MMTLQAVLRFFRRQHPSSRTLSYLAPHCKCMLTPDCTHDPPQYRSANLMRIASQNLLVRRLYRAVLFRPSKQSRESGTNVRRMSNRAHSSERFNRTISSRMKDCQTPEKRFGAEHIVAVLCQIEILMSQDGRGLRQDA